MQDIFRSEGVRKSDMGSQNVNIIFNNRRNEIKGWTGNER